MSASTDIRHVVSIAGSVQDSVTDVRLGQALVEIVDGPPEFLARVQTLSNDPAWRRRQLRIDRTTSQADGIFYFVDLPAGAYHLRVSLPGLGSRYGAVDLGPVQVRAGRDADGRVFVARADAALPPTHIAGVVTRGDTLQALADARVRLRGDGTVVATNEEGRYALMKLIAGTPTLEVSATHFVTASRKVSLAPGQGQTVNVVLQPA